MRRRQLSQRGRGPAGRDAGTVTAELAMTLPGVVLMVIALLVTGQAALDEVRCTDAARAAARMAARGEAAGVILAEARRLAPSGARISLSRSGTQVTVSVEALLGSPAPAWARLSLHATSTADVEGSTQ